MDSLPQPLFRIPEEAVMAAAKAIPPTLQLFPTKAKLQQNQATDAAAVQGKMPDDGEM
jgi:hypothetical protein